MKKEDSEKEQELDLLRQEVKNLRVEATREREALMADFSQKVTALEIELQDKEEEVHKWFKILHFVDVRFAVHVKLL